MKINKLIHHYITKLRTSMKYYCLSRDRNRDGIYNKLNHQKLCGIIYDALDGEVISSRTINDYNRGHEYWIVTPYGTIHFELNKLDKDVNWDKKSKSYVVPMGQNRAKIAGYSKNGYIITLPEALPTSSRDKLCKSLRLVQIIN